MSTTADMRAATAARKVVSSIRDSYVDDLDKASFIPDPEVKEVVSRNAKQALLVLNRVIEALRKLEKEPE